jgi:hypothetical protein
MCCRSCGTGTLVTGEAVSHVQQGSHFIGKWVRRGRFFLANKNSVAADDHVGLAMKKNQFTKGRANNVRCTAPSATEGPR